MSERQIIAILRDMRQQRRDELKHRELEALAWCIAKLTSTAGLEDQHKS